MLIDTHSHLDATEFAADRDSIFDYSCKAGITHIVVPAVEPMNFEAVLACCTRYPGCFPAYGIHPLFIGKLARNELNDVRTWLEQQSSGDFPPVAVGEIGLDFYQPGVDAAQQEFYLAEQLNIAHDLDLPVLLHVRRSVDQVLKYVRHSGVRGGIAHAFNGSRQQADAFLGLGFKLGFGGAMTYPGSKRIRQLAATLPIEAIVLETDAPDIPPCWLSGDRNSPAELFRIAQTFAELRGIDLAQAVAATSDNALSVLRLQKQPLQKP